MKNKLWLISIAVSILLIISTIFTIGETRKLKIEISDLQSEIIELQSVDKESFKITQEEIDALYQLTKTQEEDLSALTELVINQEIQIESLQEQIDNSVTATVTAPTDPDAIYSASAFKNMGVINWDGWRWTWYSESILPGGGLDIPGRYTDSEGWVRDENGYICLASSTLPFGTIIDTPFGSSGKIYDAGCAAGTIDVYTNW